jgi:hypothetical protein
MPRLRMEENMAKAVCSSKNSILSISISGSVYVSAGEGWCSSVGDVRVEVQYEYICTVYSVAISKSS